MSQLLTRLQETKDFLLSFCGSADWAIVLGSGFGSVIESMSVEKEISYSEIPNFKSPSVSGHKGKLVVGKLGNSRVLALQGRLHYYEGHEMQDVVYAVRALAFLGIEKFLLTNASGTLRTEWMPPTLVLISDHINLMGTNPLVGLNYDFLGPRFPDLSSVYDPNLGAVFIDAARNCQIELRKGVYAGILGPCYETPAEIRLYRNLGADLVGMSTIPEAIALRHMGKRVVALSCVTNAAASVSEPVFHSDVLERVDIAAPLIRKLITESFLLS